jgi:hypothetical protein
VPALANVGAESDPFGGPLKVIEQSKKGTTSEDDFKLAYLAPDMNKTCAYTCFISV